METSVSPCRREFPATSVLGEGHAAAAHAGSAASYRAGATTRAGEVAAGKNDSRNARDIVRSGAPSVVATVPPFNFRNQ